MIQIKGEIGLNDPNRPNDGFTYANFIGQLTREKGKIIEVEIDSIGGLVDEGIMMYDDLMAQKKLGKEIHTRAVNKCMSIASVIFMAGDRRYAGCDIVIHNPLTKAEGDSELFAELSKVLSKAKKTLRDIYCTVVKVNNDTVDRLMSVESYISPEDAVSMGFATHVLPNIKNINSDAFKGKAIINQKFVNKMTKASVNPLRNIVFRTKAKMGINIKNALTYRTTVEGIDGYVELYVDREEGEPQIGDIAFPDGDHLLENGDRIIVTEGMISEIILSADPNMPTIEEITDMVNYIEQLETENRVLAANQREESDAQVLNQVKAAGGIEKLISGKFQIKSKYTVPTRTGGKVTNQVAKKGVTDLEAEKAKIHSRFQK